MRAAIITHFLLLALGHVYSFVVFLTYKSPFALLCVRMLFTFAIAATMGHGSMLTLYMYTRGKKFSIKISHVGKDR